MMAFVTVLRTVSRRPANKRFVVDDGTPRKTAYGDAGAYLAQVVRADTPEVLAALLAEVGGRPDALMMLGFVPALAPSDGAARGPMFRIIPRKLAAAGLGLPKDAPPAQIDAAFGPEPRTLRGAPTVMRTLGFWRQSGWMLFDRDPSGDMPDDIRHIVADDAAWLAAMERVAPGFVRAGRVRLRSSTGRVRWNGAPLPAAGAHEYVLLDTAAAVGAVARALFVGAALAGLTWQKPARARNTGEVVSRTAQPVWDPATFGAERLVFVGAPVVEGEGLTLDPPAVEVFPGELFPAATAPEPTAEDLKDAAAKTGASFGSGFRRSRRGRDCGDSEPFSGPAATARDLTLDQAVEFQDHGYLTVREACARGLDDTRAQVPAEFRMSSSWNAMFWREENGAPLLWDRGARVRHVLSDTARAAWEAEFGLPPEVKDAPSPPPLMSLNAAGEAVARHLEAWLTDAFVLTARRIQHQVWAASWECDAVPPDAFLPRPEPLRVQVMQRPMGRMEMLRVSTAVGKTTRMARQVVAALAAAPMVLGLPRRVFVVAKDHRVADELALECVRVAAEQGAAVSVSRYRGISADDPSAPGQKMCPCHQARGEAHRAGLSSGRLCSVKAKGDAEDDDPNGDGRRSYCQKHPDHPKRRERACGWADQDLSGAIVVFAGWASLVRALSDQRLRRHVRMQSRDSDSKVEVEVDPCDALVLDESDMGQLIDGGAVGGEEPTDGGGGGPGDVRIGALPGRLWPGMRTTDRKAWMEAAGDDALRAEADCTVLLGQLRAMVAALAEGESLSPAALARVATAEQWDAASRWAWKAKDRDAAALRPNVPAHEVAERLGESRRHNRTVSATARLLRLCAEAVEHCPEDEVTELVRIQDGRLLMRGALLLHEWCRDLPTMLLDATGDPALLRTWWPTVEVRAEIHAEWAARGVEHVVAHDYAGTYGRLTPGRGDDAERVAAAGRAAEDLAALADALAWIFERKVLVAGPHALVEDARARARTVAARDAAHWMHFGAARGLNAAEDVRVALVVGRPLPPSNDVELTAALLRHGKPVTEAECGYRRVPSYHRMADGKARQGERYGHVDQLADAVLRWRTCAELEQTEQRARLRRRNMDRPVLMLSDSNLALEDRRRVDRLISHRAIRALHPEVEAVAGWGVVLRRSDRGAMAVLAMLLDPEGAKADPEAAARRQWDRLRRWDDALLWQAAVETTGAPVDASPEALARWDAKGEGWAAAARAKIRAETHAGLWWPARVKLRVENPNAVCVAVRATTVAEAAARLAEALGADAAVEWMPRAADVRALPAKDRPTAIATGAPAQEALRSAAAGGGIMVKAEAMIATGLVPLSREHAHAVYPGLFGSVRAADRAIRAARTLLAEAAKVHGPDPKAEKPYKEFYTGNPLSALSRALLVAGMWCFRVAESTAKRLATVLVVEGCEAEARARLTTALGPLSVWRRATAAGVKRADGVSEETPDCAPASQPPLLHIEAGDRRDVDNHPRSHGVGPAPPVPPLPPQAPILQPSGLGNRHSSPMAPAAQTLSGASATIAPVSRAVLPAIPPAVISGLHMRIAPDDELRWKQEELLGGLVGKHFGDDSAQSEPDHADLQRPSAWLGPAASPPKGAWCFRCGRFTRGGGSWWREAEAPTGWCCSTCHPAPPGMDVVEVRT